MISGIYTRQIFTTMQCVNILKLILNILFEINLRQ